MKRTATIRNLLEGLSPEDIAVVGTTGQVQLTKSEEGKYDAYEFFNTVAEAEAEKNKWEREIDLDIISE